MTPQIDHVVELSTLCGLRELDARGEFIGVKAEHQDDSPRVVVLRLDGVLYWFQEDPSDGYRSSLSHVRIAAAPDIPRGGIAEFPSRLVNCWLSTAPTDNFYNQRDEVLVGLDEATHSVLFEIGTTNLDDYYPSFIAEWNPPEAAA